MSSNNMQVIFNFMILDIKQNSRSIMEHNHVTAVAHIPVDSKRLNHSDMLTPKKRRKKVNKQTN